MRIVRWDDFKTDNEILEYLRKLPRYKNTAIKSAYRRALFFLSLIYCRILKLNKPLFIVLVTNNSCNLRCSYCYGKYGDRKIRDYSTKELLKIIDELKLLGGRLLTVHGGESLLRKDMGEILNYAKLSNFYVSLNTNGYFVPKKINELKCLDTIVMSLDGDELCNDMNRGKGSYQKAMEAIDISLSNKLPVVISATLTQKNMNNMDFLAKLGKEKNIRIQYSILYNFDELKDDNDIAMSDKEIRKVVNHIRELKKQGYPIYYSDNVLLTTINWPAPLNKKRFFSKEEEVVSKDMIFSPCYHGKLKYQIDADGRVITCWAHDYSDAPNIKELGVDGAIKACHDNDNCQFCSFLANNEHNALMHLSPKNVWNILCIQISDAFKIRINK
jgi:MoaA/NifB/PqqE/SkfB family radical SAM enzyme